MRINVPREESLRPRLRVWWHGVDEALNGHFTRTLSLAPSSCILPCTKQAKLLRSQ